MNLPVCGNSSVDSKSIKRHRQLDWILMLLGVTCVKAVCKYVGEISPRSDNNNDNNITKQ